MSVLEIPPDTATKQRAGTVEPPATPAKRKSRQGLTRQGKHRLQTIEALDRRTAAAQSALKLIETLSSSLGGDDQLSAQQRQLVTRAALTGAMVADFEARWVAGEPVPLAEYLAAVNTQRRVLATLGLERRQKDITTTPPSVEAYLAHVNAQEKATATP